MRREPDVGGDGRPVVRDVDLRQADGEDDGAGEA